MGDVSYSIYLIHPLVFVVAKSVTTLAPPIWSQALLPPRHLQHLVRRLGCNLGRSLSAAIQHHRLEQSAALESLYQLTQAEAAFRIQKDQLNVRPIWHQRQELWKSLEMWQQRAGLENSPRTIIEELARIESHDVVLPTATHGQMSLRCVTQPDPAQAALLDLISASSCPSAYAPTTGRRRFPNQRLTKPHQKCSANFSTFRLTY